MTSHPPIPDPAPGPHADSPPIDSGSQLRAGGERVLEWAAAYLDSLADRPVRTPTAPGDLLADLPRRPPEHAPADAGAELDAILRDLDEKILPRLVHWQSPDFFAFFPCNHSPPAILASLVSSALNVNGMNWANSPAVTELETRVLDWMAGALGLPDAFRSDADNRGLGGGGVIQSTASDATLVALLAARNRARRLAPAPRDHAALVREEFCLITSDQAHSSVTKAAMVAGIASGPDDDRHVRLVRTDPQGRMDTHELGRIVGELLAGRSGDPPAPAPIFVSATLGTTSTGAIDDVAAIRAALDRAALEHTGSPWGGWLHVDAAWAGAALVCPEHRAMGAGLAHADSICVNPHKWLLTNFDCDLFWTRSRRDVTDALSLTPEYLRNDASESGAVIDYRDWQVPLGRSFRALKLWFVLRMYGLDALRAHIRRHVALAECLEARVLADERFDVPVPRSLSLVCLSLRAGDEATAALLEHVNASGRALVSHARLAARGDEAGRLVIRVAIGATLTSRAHVEALWTLLCAGTDAVLGSAP